MARRLVVRSSPIFTRCVKSFSSKANGDEISRKKFPNSKLDLSSLPAWYRKEISEWYRKVTSECEEMGKPLKLTRKESSEMRRVSLSYSPLLINDFLDRLRIEKAIDLVKKLRAADVHVLVRAYNTLLSFFFRNVMVKEAEALLPMILKTCGVPTIETYNTLVKGYCEVSEVRVARKIFEQMRRGYEGEGNLPDITTFNAVLSGYFESGLTDQGLLFFREELNGLEADEDTYSTVMHGLFISRRPNWAVVIYDEMLARGVETTDKSYGTFLRGLCMNGGVIEAFDYFCSEDNWHLNKVAFQLWCVIEKKGLRPDKSTFLAMMEGLCRLNCFKEAKWLLLNLMERNVRVGNGFNMLSEAMLKMGMKEEQKLLARDVKSLEGVALVRMCEMVVDILNGEY